MKRLLIYLLIFLTCQLFPQSYFLAEHFSEDPIGWIKKYEGEDFTLSKPNVEQARELIKAYFDAGTIFAEIGNCLIQSRKIYGLKESLSASDYLFLAETFLLLKEPEKAKLYLSKGKSEIYPGLKEALIIVVENQIKSNKSVPDKSKRTEIVLFGNILRELTGEVRYDNSLKYNQDTSITGNYLNLTIAFLKNDHWNVKQYLSKFLKQFEYATFNGNLPALYYKTISRVFFYLSAFYSGVSNSLANVNSNKEYDLYSKLSSFYALGKVPQNDENNTAKLIILEKDGGVKDLKGSFSNYLNNPSLSEQVILASLKGLDNSGVQSLSEIYNKLSDKPDYCSNKATLTFAIFAGIPLAVEKNKPEQNEIDFFNAYFLGKNMLKEKCNIEIRGFNKFIFSLRSIPFLMRSGKKAEAQLCANTARRQCRFTFPIQKLVEYLFID